MIALLGHQVHHALHIARREIINPGSSRHTLVLGTQSWCGLLRAGFLHVIQQTTRVISHHIGAQSPRRIDVPEGRHQVRYI